MEEKYFPVLDTESVCLWCDSVGDSKAWQKQRRQLGKYEYFRCCNWICTHSLTVSGVGKACGFFRLESFSFYFFCTSAFLVKVVVHFSLTPVVWCEVSAHSQIEPRLGHHLVLYSRSYYLPGSCCVSLAWLHMFLRQWCKEQTQPVCSSVAAQKTKSKLISHRRERGRR